MAVVLGYGGLANTNGARDFSGKVEAVVEAVLVIYRRWTDRPFFNPIGPPV